MSENTMQDRIPDQRAGEKATPTQPAKPAPGTADKRKHIDKTLRDAEKHRDNGY